MLLPSVIKIVCRNSFSLLFFHLRSRQLLPFFPSPWSSFPTLGGCWGFFSLPRHASRPILCFAPFAGTHFLSSSFDRRFFTGQWSGRFSRFNRPLRKSDFLSFSRRPRVPIHSPSRPRLRDFMPLPPVPRWPPFLLVMDRAWRIYASCFFFFRTPPGSPTCRIKSF